MPVCEVTLGIDVETRNKITIGDIERRSGLYILGIQGSGKTTLIKSLILQDIENGHGVFFLDPHGDAIDDLLPRIPPKRRDDVILLNPAEETHTFGINLLECRNPTSLTERNRTYSQAIDLFTKLFADPQKEELDILLSQYLPNCFFPLIVNQGYTLCEVPFILEDKQFRDQLLDNPDVPYEVVRFWHNTFDPMPPKDKREEIASTLRRLNRFLTYEYTKHIIGQTQTTLNFTKIMDNGKILFVKLTDALPRDVWRIIGTMLVSNLVRAVFDREKQPEAARRHFCIFVDEFEKFASSEDFAVLFTQARKYHIATTIAHQERFGQFADNKRIAGATLTAAHLVCFCVTTLDAPFLAPAYAKESPTATRQERHLGISQEPFADLLRGHKHPDILSFVNKYLRPLQHRLEDTREDIEGERLLRLALLDEAALSRVDERYEAMHASMARGRAIPISTEALHNTEQILMQTKEQTERLIRLHDIARGLRLSIRSLNAFLTAIMEGRLQPEPGNELFSHFLLAFVPKFVSVSGQAAVLLELYISLRYGNPHLPRAIPMSLAAKYLGVSHEELYREAEAQYTRHVQAYVDRVHREAEVERSPQRQDEYERVLAHVMTWKLELRGDGGAPDEKTRALFHLLQHRQVRTLLAPYFFATFAPPWNYTGGMPSSNEREGVAEFIRQYGEGASVTLSLLYTACTGWRTHSANWRATKDAPLNRVHTYPNLHMLEIPAITGKEPLVVWQLITKLAATLTDLGVFSTTTQLLYDLGLLSTTTQLLWSGRPTLDQSSPVRADALLLREVLQKRAENALPATWWESLDEQAQKYLIYRACDLVAYGDIVADRTFPQPTLPGATPLQVSAVVTALMVLLMDAQGKAKASRDQE